MSVGGLGRQVAELRRGRRPRAGPRVTAGAVPKSISATNAPMRRSVPGPLQAAAGAQGVLGEGVEAEAARWRSGSGPSSAPPARVRWRVPARLSPPTSSVPDVAERHAAGTATELPVAPIPEPGERRAAAVRLVPPGAARAGVGRPPAAVLRSGLPSAGLRAALGDGEGRPAGRRRPGVAHRARRTAGPAVPAAVRARGRPDAADRDDRPRPSWNVSSPSCCAPPDASTVSGSPSAPADALTFAGRRRRPRRRPRLAARRLRRIARRWSSVVRRPRSFRSCPASRCTRERHRRRAPVP